MSKEIIEPPFSWVGNKWRMINWLLEHFPPKEEVARFIDIFGGSGCVSLNAGYVETIFNDTNKDVVNFFRTLRGDFGGELLRRLELTLWSREELYISYEAVEGECEIERARRFFTRVMQSIFALETRHRQWNVTKKPHWRLSRTFANRVDKLPKLREFLELFRGLIIENLDALELIERYDHKDVFFYADPPYPSYVRIQQKNSSNLNQYNHDAGDEFHEKLAAKLNSCEAKVMISSYQSDEYDQFYAPPKWRKAKWAAHVSPITHTERQEVIWANYELAKSGEFKFNYNE